MNAVRWTFGVWIALFYLFIPFPMEFIPDVGSHLSKTLLPITELLSDTPSNELSKTFTFSDSIHLYSQALVILTAALPIGVFLSKKSNQKDLSSVLNQIIAFVIGFFLLKYGIEKLTHLQFPEPPPNILYTPAGQLDKDIFFWTLMGTSNTYAWFMGIIEILCALFLFAPKTRIIGAFISMGIFLNIFFLNISFDITVKLLSFSLLFSSIYLIHPYLKPIVELLTHKPTHRIENHKVKMIPEIWKRAIKGIAFTLIILECTVPLFDRVEHENILIGSYEVKQIQSNSSNIDLNSVKRIHFHPGGYLITESKDNKFKSHAIHYPKGSSNIKLIKTGEQIHFERNTTEWTFRWNNSTSTTITCKRLNNEQLPLLKDQFHWTVESMLAANFE